MQASRSPSAAAVAEQASVETLLAAIDRLGREAIAEKDFYREVLQQLLRTGFFEAVAVWSIDESGAVLKACAPSDVVFPGLPERCLEHVFSTEAMEVDRGDFKTNGMVRTGTRSLLAGARIDAAEGVAVEGVPKVEGTVPRDSRLLEAVAELIGHVETRFRYLSARSRSAVSGDVERVIRTLHEGRSLRETALLIASGFQELSNCDRAWTCRVSGGRARVESSSAPGDVARRQLLVKRVEEAATTGIAGGCRIEWTVGEAGSRGAPQLLALADEGGARRIVVLPLIRSAASPPVGAVVLEQFTGVASAAGAGLDQLTAHAAIALDRAIEFDGGWRRRISDGGPHRWQRRVAALVAGVAILLFLLAPIPFEVEAEGQLLPTRMRSVFAPADGVVTSIHVRHGEAVDAEHPLITLRSPELDLERERVIGQISELNAKLAAIQVLRTQGRPAAADSTGELSAQEEQVQVAIQGALEQRRLIDEQSARLELRSPIDGLVDRWDLREALMSRPVVRGQHLCDVLDVDGDWKLELRIPDRTSGAVLSARADRQSLPVRFVVRSDPEAEYSTTLDRIGERTEVDEAGGLSVPATAGLERRVAFPRRAGASVLARIDCGRRSRGYVWFHELWEAVALRFL